MGKFISSSVNLLGNNMSLLFFILFTSLTIETIITTTIHNVVSAFQQQQQRMIQLPNNYHPKFNSPQQQQQQEQRQPFIVFSFDTCYKRNRHSYNKDRKNDGFFLFQTALHVMRHEQNDETVLQKVGVVGNSQDNDTNHIESNYSRSSMEHIVLAYRNWYSYPTFTTDATTTTTTTTSILSSSSSSTTLQPLVLLTDLLDTNIVWDDCHYTYQPIIGIQNVIRHLQLQRFTCILQQQQQIQEKNKHSIENNTITKLLLTDDIIYDNNVIGFTFYNSIVTRSNNNNNSNNTSTTILPNTRGIVLLDVHTTGTTTSTIKIIKATIIREKSIKLGEFNLWLLSLASTFFSSSSSSLLAASDQASISDDIPTARDEEYNNKKDMITLPERYYAAWNNCDMGVTTINDLFTDDIYYDDTAFVQPLVGIEEVQQHLIRCAKCLPSSFTFIVDRVISNTHEEQEQQDSLTKSTKMIVSWHVENNSGPLPFTNGLSYYEIHSQDDPNNQQHNQHSKTKISKGIDYVDSESIKVASIVDLVSLLYQYEPIRIVPTIAWILYMYVVFFSDNLLPGANLLQFEIRTWEEVRDLSLNFFLVAPLLHLPFSPSVHPMLEGIFNVLLSWAALFAGFLSDDRNPGSLINQKFTNKKPNLLPMVPTIIGMQFLTSAFLLPYLTTRTPESIVAMNVIPNDNETSRKPMVVLSDLDTIAQITENRLFGPILAFVGFYSIVWSFIGRYDEYGDIQTRFTSLQQLLSIDRVGCSFIVDLIIFGIFQGWFIDDDMKRRCCSINGDPIPTSTPSATSTNLDVIQWIGKYIPFFGLAIYFVFRPSYNDT